MTIVVCILAAIFALFFFLQLAMIFKARNKRGKPAPNLAGEYENAGQGGQTALFYFFSPGCAACRPMVPIINKLRKSSTDVFEINVAEDLATARKFGIMGTPASVFVRKGKIIEFLLGPQSEDKLSRLLNTRS